MGRWLYCSSLCTGGSFGVLGLRVVMGLAFILHGWGKVQNPTGWMPNSPIPGVLQAAAAFSEFGGGIALIAGLLTPVAATLLAVTMAVAVKFHFGQGHPFVGAGGPSYELAAVYLAAAIMFVFVGPGRFSLDAVLFGKQRAVTAHTEHA
ncbi:MAG: DoxX family protein [Planctomycetaceae bacterium]|nr:DoxX family protein [Planctomycetaceae bacterium]